MALAAYYGRGALAAAQVLDGFDEGHFRARLEQTPVGIAFDETIATPEGHALAEFLTRMAARLYPQMAISGPTTPAGELASLARAINPAIEITSDATVGVAIGKIAKPFPTTFHAGATGWDGLLSTTRPQPVGDSQNPFGAAVAACLSAANIFRRVFLPDRQEHADNKLRFSAWTQDRADRPTRVTRTARSQWRLDDDAVLVGVGAIGNAALWALANAPAEGTLHLVDPQDIELSNLQRYVLATRDDEGRSKVGLGAALETRGLTLVPHQLPLAEFLAHHGYAWSHILLGLDTAQDRRSAQASLPRWIGNAWTQPGDLGVSTHPHFGGPGACVACLYLPSHHVKNEDEIVAQALSVPHLQMDIRTLLYNGTPLEHTFLEAVAAALGRPVDSLAPFEGRTIRDLYVEGICGGAVIPLGEAGHPSQDIHVPLSHQSALAGILLAATLIRSALGGDPPGTTATRIDVLHAVGTHLAQPVQAQRDGRCICDDPVYKDQYAAKYAKNESTSPQQ
jgi:hypothetical protein